MGPICCPETSVTNYQSTLRNIPEERICHLHRSGSLESRSLGMLWRRGKPLAPMRNRNTISRTCSQQPTATIGVVSRAVEFVHKTSDSSIFKPPVPTPTPTPQFLNLRFRLQLRLQLRHLHKSSMCIT
jgi:hypothetical protein